MDHRRVPLSAKLNILIVVTILAVSVGLMITGYQAYCRKVDDFLYARCEDAAGAPSAKPEQLLPFIRRQIDLFAGQEPQFDDITMMGLQYLGPSEQ